jgi:3-hydroxy-9,10-secoandrosta-1,3,5(10)-triene-9,17-dione monooxygenase reductase component
MRNSMPQDPRQFDSTELRRALSCFATGVAVATARDASGEPAGITINSFNSVSLDPPLVLWSIGKDSYSYEAFTGAAYFAVNVLTREQLDVSARFAQRNGNKFDGIVTRDGLHGVPLLPECAACFQCRTEHIYEGGDHKIIVGRVLSIEERETDPLIFYRGRYMT